MRNAIQWSIELGHLQESSGEQTWAPSSGVAGGTSAMLGGHRHRQSKGWHGQLLVEREHEAESTKPITGAADADNPLVKELSHVASSFCPFVCCDQSQQSSRLRLLAHSELSQADQVQTTMAIYMRFPTLPSCDVGPAW